MLFFVIEFTFAQAPPPPPPPPPLPSAPKDCEEGFNNNPDEWPLFPGCEDGSGYTKEKRKCSDDKMYAFIYDNLIYPEKYRELGKKGTIVITFYITCEGEIVDEKIVRHLEHKEFGEEGLRVIRLMREQTKLWTPGKQIYRDKRYSLKTRYNVPIKFNPSNIK